MDPAALLSTVTEILDVVLPDGQRRALNEANTRAEAIDPIIRALGYRGPDQVDRESPVGRSGQSLDYVLTAPAARIAVEAKPLQTALGDREASQLVGYIAQEGIRWAILTNGLDWHIFDNRVDRDWEEKRVATIDLEAARRSGRLEEAIHPLTLFARSTLVGSDADLGAWSLRERARAHLADLLGDPSSSAVKAIVASMRTRGMNVSPSHVVDLLRARTAAASPPAPAHRVAEDPASYPVPATSPHVVTTPPSPPPTRRRRRAKAHTGVQFYLFPASEHDGYSGLDHLKAWLNSGKWGLWRSTAFRRVVKSGDRCCFYAVGAGVVAMAEIADTADREITREAWPGPTDWNSDTDTYTLPLRDIRWLPRPIPITLELRSRLDAFEEKQPDGKWVGLCKVPPASMSTTSTSSPVAPDPRPRAAMSRRT